MAKIELDLENLAGVDKNIEAVQRVIDGNPMRGVDIAPMLDTLSILKGIRIVAHRKGYYYISRWKSLPDYPEKGGRDEYTK